MPNKLINNQNNSMINADKLKLNKSENKIAEAPVAFNKLNLSEWISILFNCNNKQVAKIKKTPMFPTKSYQ